jgi:hypothetical protein
VKTQRMTVLALTSFQNFDAPIPLKHIALLSLYRNPQRRSTRLDTSRNIDRRCPNSDNRVIAIRVRALFPIFSTNTHTS